jgi:protein CWC15
MAELNRIKQERATEAARQEEERKAREEKIRIENILKGNPLLNSGPAAASSSKQTSADFKVKRRWDDDVVFKNCAKLDNGQKKGFVNDTLRSEFHKKFMDRYIK